MTTIRIKLTSALPPERVLFGARDFGQRRFDVWPAVRAAHFTVHSHGHNVADVTEGTPAGIGINWERCDYDWSTPGVVVATVTDSNVYAVPGSAWQLTATESNSGSHVEMTWIRRFRHTPRGIVFGAALPSARPSDVPSVRTPGHRQPRASGSDAGRPVAGRGSDPTGPPGALTAVRKSADRR